MLPRLFSRLAYLPAIVICLTLHEAGHGLASYLLGDRTARSSGRMSLNPLAHIDPLGLAMMLFFGFGWAKPVPVDPSRFRRPKLGMALTALAGPAANMLTAAVALALSGFAGPAVAPMLYVLASYSVSLAAFNLIPIPPLDGSRLVLPFLSDRAAYAWSRLDRYGWIALMALSCSGLLQVPIRIAQSAMFSLLAPLM